jgi:hypothetical protein
MKASGDRLDQVVQRAAPFSFPFLLPPRVRTQNQFGIRALAVTDLTTLSLPACCAVLLRCCRGLAGVRGYVGGASLSHSSLVGLRFLFLSISPFSILLCLF